MSNYQPIQFVNKHDLSQQHQNKLTKSKTFCMMPWVHLHAFPDGRAYPCCLSDYRYPVGDLRANSMEEVWNQDKIKTMRVNMLNDKPSIECTRCYEQEKHGAKSMRITSNLEYKHHIADTDLTYPNGFHPEFKLRYWDVRFSNLCNFRCRTCGPMFSSNWYSDHITLYDTAPIMNGNIMTQIEYVSGKSSNTEVIDNFNKHVFDLEKIYFAGGEPLLMKEHYILLDKLIECGRTDVCIHYNTNFSELVFKGKHIFEYWKKFSNITVAASLDGMGKHAELIRKGTDWEAIEKNRLLMIEQVPHVNFRINCTISSLNVLHALEFHKNWVARGLVAVTDWDVNICQSPNWYRADIFPKWFKDAYLIPAYKEHIEWILESSPEPRTVTGYSAMLRFIEEESHPSNLVEFIAATDKLDSVRGESFWELEPEIATLVNRN